MKASLIKNKAVIDEFVSTPRYPSPGVRSNENNSIKLAKGKFNNVPMDVSDFLDMLAVYHLDKPSALVYLIPSVVNELVDSDLNPVRTKTWAGGYPSYFISKDKNHSEYMAKMFTNYVNLGISSTLFHCKMGIGLGYSKEAILDFLTRIRK